MDRAEDNHQNLNARLATSGLRFTPQRQHVYNILMDQRDHPTAEEVFIRAKKTMPDISIATVYNCLDALVTCGLVRQVHLDRVASRYCPNMQQHSHFYCETCGGVFDLDFDESAARVGVPRGYEISQVDLAYRGACPACATSESKTSRH